MNFKWMKAGFSLILLTSYFLLLTFIVSCGRRGDPVLPYLYQEQIEKKAENGDKAADSESGIIIKDANAEKASVAVVPDSPKGLTALYTQKGIVLVWDEVSGQGVRYYRLYRSTGDTYILLGEPLGTAYTDSNVEQNNKYYYKVTAVGEHESEASASIEVLTEARDK